MFIGHYGVAFAAKRAAPETSLGVLFAAAQMLDLIWPILLLAGVEHVAPGDRGFTAVVFTDYPWSHSLLMAIGWAVAFGTAYGARARDTRGATVVALLVASHWILDVITHRPDLPLVPGGATRVGLGLWTHTAAALVVELIVFAVGLAIYLAGSRARDVRGRIALWSFVVSMLVIYAGTIVGPPPPSMRAVAWTALAVWITPFWGSWIDRHRAWRPRAALTAAPAAEPTP